MDEDALAMIGAPPTVTLCVMQRMVGVVGSTGPYKTEDEARLAWNTRAPILSSQEMEMLEGME